MGAILDTSQFRAVAARLATAGDRARGRLATAIVKTGYDIQADAQILAPVDTGALKNSISTSVSGSSASLTVEVGPTVEYGIWQELGTSTQPAQPYLGPAYDRRIPGLTDAIAQIGVDEL